MKLKLFLILLAVAIVVLALGGWTVKGARRVPRLPALFLAATPLRSAPRPALAA